jgi:hypothetical protein
MTGQNHQTGGQNHLGKIILWLQGETGNGEAEGFSCNESLDACTPFAPFASFCGWEIRRREEPEFPQKAAKRTKNKKPQSLSPFWITVVWLLQSDGHGLREKVCYQQ